MTGLSVSKRVDGKWQAVDLSRYATGEELAADLLTMDGQECVAEYTRGEWRILVCGDEKQAQAYRERRAEILTFRAFVRKGREMGLFDGICEALAHPLIKQAQELFGAPVTRQQISL